MSEHNQDKPEPKSLEPQRRKGRKGFLSLKHQDLGFPGVLCDFAVKIFFFL
jgi:hypothetical protein